MTDKTDSKLKVFISYSRTDLAFADQLLAALEAYGFVVIIDRHNIVGGEQFEKRLAGLILEADTVVFVLSPQSAVAHYVLWEVEEAHRRGKRLIPVVCEPLGVTPVPERLESLDYIFFYPEEKSTESGFGKGIKRLVAALDTDLDWIREHTRVMAQAARWEGRDKADALLLRGDELVDAERWFATRPANAAEPAAPLPEFLAASRAAEIDRSRQEEARLKEIAAAQEARARALEGMETAQQQREDALARMGAEQAARAVAQGRTKAWTAAFVAFGIMVLMAGTWQASVNSRQVAELLLRGAQTAFEQQRYDAAMRYALAAMPPEGATPLAARLPQAEVELARAADRSRLIARLGREGASFAQAQFSIDGRLILTRQKGDSGVGVFDATDGRQLGRLEGHTGEVTRFKVLANGRVVTLSTDKTVRVWDAVARKAVAVLSGHAAPVTSIAESRDGSRIAAWSSGQPARIWDVARQQPLATIDPGPRGFKRVDFTADGTRLINSTAGYDSIEIWNAETGQPIPQDWQLANIRRGRISTSGNRMVLFGTRGEGRDRKRLGLLIDTRTGAIKATLESSAISSQFSSDGRLLALHGFSTPVVQVYDAQTGALLREIGDHRVGVTQVEFNEAGSKLATVDDDGTLRLWGLGPTDPAAEQLKIELPDFGFGSLMFDRAGRRLLIRPDRGPQRVWDIETNKLLGELPPANIGSTMFSPDGTQLLIHGQHNPEVKLWSPGAVQSARVLWTPGSPIASFNDNGTRVLVRNEIDGAVWLWDATPQIRLVWEDAEPRAKAAGVIAAGGSLSGNALVAKKSSDKLQRIWDLRRRRVVATLSQGETVLAISDDGKKAAVLADDSPSETGSIIKIIDLNGTSPAIEVKPSSQLSDNDLVRFSPDGSRMMTMERYVANAPVEVWDTSSGRRLKAYKSEHERPEIGEIAIDHAGKWLALSRHTFDASTLSSARYSVDIMSLDTNAIVRTAIMPEQITGLAFVMNGTRLLVWGQHKAALLLDVATLKVDKQFEAGKLRSWVTATALNRDASRLLTVTDDDNSMQVWSTATTRMIGPTMKHEDRVASVRLSPDGRLAVTITDSGTVRVWDVDTAMETITIPARAKRPESSALFAAFNVDATEIRTAESDGKLRVWDIRLATLRGEALRRKVCNDLLRGVKAFSSEEIGRDAILRGDKSLANPCTRRGLMSAGYWAALPGRLWETARGLVPERAKSAAVAK